MPMKLSAGVSRKVGLPHYSSLGASCHIEIELDSALLTHDPDIFHQHVCDAYVACARAVDEELARNQAAMADPNRNGLAAPGPDRTPGGNGSAPPSPDATSPSAQRASSRQGEYARVLAGQIRGLGLRRLETFCQALLGKPMAELSSEDASRLIDVLKDIRGGRMDLSEILAGGAS
jgi:hypothetical protein